MDALSAMRMTAAGRITPFNPPVLGQGGKISPDELKQLGGQFAMGDISKLGDLSKMSAQLQMPDQIKQIGNIPAVQSPTALPSFGGIENGRAFSDFLGEMVHDVNAKQAAANNAVDGVLSGQNIPLHQAMLSVEEASVSFQLMVEVRNKLLDSYQELMRMQI
jgi:flagellar hook-basal body complex protein FliE